MLSLQGKPLPFQPVRDNVLCQELKEQQGGIVLPDGVDTGPPRMKVLAVGEGRLCENGSVVPYPVQPGDIVYVKPNMHNPSVEFPHNGENFLLVHGAMIAGVEPKTRYAALAAGHDGASVLGDLKDAG